MQYGRPPRLGRFLVRVQPLGDRRREIASDLLELFEQRVDDRGRRYASWRYLIDALSLWRMWSLAAVRDGLISLIPRRSWVAGGGADVVFALRLFRREPTLFSLTIAGVALAIALATSVFSVVHAVLNYRHGIPTPESVYQITIGYGAASRGAPWQYRDYLQLHDAARSFGVAAATRGLNRLTFGDVSRETERPRYVSIGAVSGEFFTVMRGRAAIGRTLTEVDDRAGMPAGLVLSDRFWRSEFASDREIVGRTVRLQHEVFTVIGVAARGFEPTDGNEIPAGWMSLTAFAELQERQPKSEFDRNALSVNVWTTLGPHTSRSRVETEATAVVVSSAAARGLVDPDNRPRAFVSTLMESRGDRSFLVFAASVAITVVALVVVLASANVANLLLASAAGRSREIGVRMTLGPSRFRVVRQLLTESVLLGLAGGAVGLLLAFWTAPVLARLLNLPDIFDVTPSPSVLAFSVLVTIAVALVAGLAPARYGRRGELVTAINSGVPTATSMTTGRLRSVLIGAQAAVSIVLLAVSALLTRALIEVIRFDLGLPANQLVKVSPEFRKSHTRAHAQAYLEAAQERLRRLPGVRGVSLTLIGPFEEAYAPMRVGPQTGRTVGGYLRGEAAIEVMRYETTADYFDTIGARIVRGRSYTADEARTTAPVAVISESLARRFWPGEDPIGSSLTRVWGEETPSTGIAMGFLRKPVGTRVVGVVSETVTRLRNYDSPSLYLPLDPLEMRRARILVRTTSAPEGMMAAIKNAVAVTDPDVGVSASLVREGLRDQLRYPKAFALVAGVFSLTTLALAALGLFGVTSFVVRQRRREVSVRLALGATGRDVVTLLLQDSLRPVVIGMIGGLFLAFLGGHVIRGMLYGVSGHDPVAVSSAILTLLTVALVAVLGPARRSLRVDPAEMLKQS